MIFKTFSLLLFLLLALASCSKPEPSYESGFKDEITINYPPGYTHPEFYLHKDRMDRELHEAKAGFVSGEMGSGSGVIDFISIDTDFDAVDEVALVEKFRQEGLIPAEAEVTYNRGLED